MLNKIFATSGIFKNTKATDVFVAIPVDVFSIETTVRDVEDNFISNTIISLHKLGLTIPEIASEMCFDKTLIKQFLDSTKEREESSLKKHKVDTNIGYIFYDKNSKSLINGYCTSEQYQSGIHLPSIVEESQNVLRIKENIASSLIHDVYILKKNDDDFFEPSHDDIKKILSCSKVEDKIVDFNYLSKEETIYIITKIYFCEKNQNRFFIYDYFGKFSDNPSLYNSVKNSLTQNPSLETKIKNCQSSYLRYYNDKMKMKTNNSLKEEFDLKRVEEIGLKPILNIVFNNFTQLISAQQNSSRDIEKYIYSLASSIYDSFEHVFLNFIVQNYTESTIDRFYELLNNNNDAITCFQIVKSYLTKKYHFSEDLRNDRAFKSIDGFAALEETLNNLEPNDNEDIKLNLFNFVFISLIMAEEDQNLFDKLLNFSLKNPYFFEQLLICKNMRIINRHDLNDNSLENSYNFVLRMFKTLIYLVHLLFAVNKGNKNVDNEDGNAINYRADISDNVTLNINKNVSNYYKKYQRYVDEIELVFKNRSLGTDALDIPYNIFVKINESLLKFVISKYVQIETFNYTGYENMQKINNNLTKCGSLGMFEKEVKAKTVLLTRDNYQDRAYQRFTFVSVLGFMAEKEPELLSNIFNKMPDLVILYEYFGDLRQHNNQVENEEFFSENLSYYQTLIDYLRFASDLEYLSLLED